PRAGRRDARALRPLAGAERTRRDVLARDAPATRALPHVPARPRSAAARRTVRRARRRGGRPAPDGARPAVRRHGPRCDARPRVPGRSGFGSAGTGMSAYAGDVAALARKDLLLELRSRDTLPAMLLFVVSALTIFHFALPSGSSERAETGLLWIAIVFTAL